MTVSKVLRNAPDVSQATKARIRRLVEEMGYVPDALAQGLRTRKTRLFGLVIPSISHPLFGPAASAIEERAHDLGFDVLLAQTQENPQREEVSIRRLLARRVDALFLCPVYRLAPSAPVYQELLASGVPTILLGHRAPFCAQFISVETEDAAASSQITKHLISLGHSQIAFFAGPPAAPWAQERFDGYRRALREAGIPPDDRLIFTAGSTLEDGQKAALQMLNESPGATAVQSSSDAVAMGAALVLMQQGCRIPEDISITGFGDHNASEHFRVPLTTVRQPKFGMGLAAMESMLHLLRGEKAELRRLPGDLVVRVSTAMPNRMRRRPSLPAPFSEIGQWTS